MAGLHSHLGQLVHALAFAPERNGADRALVAVFATQDREQDATAVGEDVAFGVSQHFAIDRLDYKPAVQPFQVEPREVIAPTGVEIDDTKVARARCSCVHHSHVTEVAFGNLRCRGAAG